MLIRDFFHTTNGMDETFLLTQTNNEQLVLSGEIITLTSKQLIIGPTDHEINLGMFINNLKKFPTNLQLFIQKSDDTPSIPLFGFKLEPSTLIFTT